MDLVRFDVDGTLTQSNEIDAECFISAMRKAFNINHIDPDWSKYKYVTDSGIFSEIYESHFHRTPDLKDFNFIGIAANADKQKLLDAGAKFVISDFEDFDRFLEMIKGYNL